MSATLSRNVQRWVKHSAIPWMAGTLDGVVEGTDAVFEAKFMLPWSFSEENIVGDVTGSPSSAVLSARVAIGLGA